MTVYSSSTPAPFAMTEVQRRGHEPTAMTPKELLTTITSALTPHLHTLLDPSLSFPQLRSTTLPVLPSVLTTALPPPPSTSHPLAQSLPPSPPLDWPAIAAAVDATLSSLRTAVLDADVESALSLFFSLAECCALVPLLPSPLPASLHSLTTAFHASSSAASPTPPSSPAATLHSARALLSSHLLRLLLSSPPPSPSDAHTAFSTLSAVVPAPILASHFTAYIHHAYPLPSSPAWAEAVDATIAAFIAAVPLLTGPVVGAVGGVKEGGEGAVALLLRAAFITPVVAAMDAWVATSGGVYDAYAEVHPHLARLSAHLSTLASTYLSVALPPCGLAPPVSVAAFLASLPPVPGVGLQRRVVDGVCVHASVAACVDQCDALVSMGGGVGWDETVPAVLAAVENRLLRCVDGGQGERGLADLLVDLTSLALVHDRWTIYQQALLSPQAPMPVAASTAPTPPSVTAATFASQLSALLAALDAGGIDGSAIPTPALAKRPGLAPLPPSQQPQSARVGAETEVGRIAAAVVEVYRRCEAALDGELALVCESYDLQALAQTRDLPLSLHPRLTNPSPTVLHLSFHLHSTDERLSALIGAGALHGRLLTRAATRAALLWVGRLSAARVSRFWSRQFRLDVVALALVLNRYRRTPGFPLLSSAVAWLVVCLGLLEAPRALIAPLLGPASPTTDVEPEVAAVLAAFDACGPTQTGRPDAAAQWAQVQWQEVWGEAGGAKCDWSALLTLNRVHAVRAAVGLPADAVACWVRKRYDLQVGDYPPLDEAEESEAQALRAVLEGSELGVGG